MNETIKTMIQQFCVNPNRLIAMIGAKNFTYDNKNNAITFSFKMCKKANMCKLKYDEADDLYTMLFYKYNSRTGEVKDIEETNGLYSDMLKRNFESFTGLYISL